MWKTWIFEDIGSKLTTLYVLSNEISMAPSHIDWVAGLWYVPFAVTIYSTKIHLPGSQIDHYFEIPKVF